MATGLLCQAGVVLLSRGPRFGLSILSEVKPPTGEPDAGNPPVRFGGRGDRTTVSPYPYPQYQNEATAEILRFALQDVGA